MVQFAPFLDASSSDWRLTWLGGRERLPDMAWENNECRSLVELAEPGKVANYSGTSGQFSRFPENEFPGNPGVTEALAGVVLDHVPAWEEARVQSFLIWLRRGGTLHVYRQVDGAWLKFRGALAVLNEPEMQRLENGSIQRHDKRLNDLTKQEAAALKQTPPMAQGQSRGRYEALRLMAAQMPFTMLAVSLGGD